MLIARYDELPRDARPDGVDMTLFFGGAPAGAGTRMGFAVFRPGAVTSPAAHDEDEYAFIISGAVKSRIGGKIIEARAGDATFIPAGEEHASFNDGTEECRLVWMLVPKKS
jgi:mannose-6-phosphate isomerase-like protein (cupin superfamily)